MADAPTTSAPDLSTMAQPGAAMTQAPAAAVAPDNPTAPALATAIPREVAAQNARQSAISIANSETPQAPVPHARLLGMVQGLADGLSAAGMSLATHGREGGAGEVVRLQGERQAQAQSAQQAATAQKNAKIQQQLMIADTNDKLAHQALFMAAIPDEIMKSHLAVSGEQLTQSEQKQSQAIQGADFAATHGGMTPDQFNQALSGTTPASGQAGPSSFFATKAQQQFDAAAKILDKNDPYLAQLQKTLADPKATAKDLWNATYSVQNQLGLQEKATDAAAKKAGLEKDQLTEGQARIANATWLRSVPKDAQGNPTQDFATWQALQNKALENAIDQGDPKVGGQMLADGTATLAELKARGSKQDFIQKEIQYAQQVTGGKYNASDEMVGEQTLKAPATQTFFGSARSLVQPGGMLDQLKRAHDALGNQRLPDYNKAADWLAFKAGTPELSAYKNAVLGAADDYAKVVGGGTPTDSARQAAADQFIYDLNNTQFDQGLETSRGAIRSQVEGRIGTNRYVAQREGDILSAPGAPKVAPSGKAVSLKSAMALPINRGKSEAEVRADIAAHGHQVGE